MKHKTTETPFAKKGHPAFGRIKYQSHTAEDEQGRVSYYFKAMGFIRQYRLDKPLPINLAHPSCSWETYVAACLVGPYCGVSYRKTKDLAPLIGPNPRCHRLEIRPKNGDFRHRESSHKPHLTQNQAFLQDKKHYQLELVPTKRGTYYLVNPTLTLDHCFIPFEDWMALTACLYESYLETERPADFRTKWENLWFLPLPLLLTELENLSPNRLAADEPRIDVKLVEAFLDGFPLEHVFCETLGLTPEASPFPDAFYSRFFKWMAWLNPDNPIGFGLIITFVLAFMIFGFGTVTKTL